MRARTTLNTLTRTNPLLRGRRREESMAQHSHSLGCRWRNWRGRRGGRHEHQEAPEASSRGYSKKTSSRLLAWTAARPARLPAFRWTSLNESIVLRVAKWWIQIFFTLLRWGQELPARWRGRRAQWGARGGQTGWREAANEDPPFSLFSARTTPISSVLFCAAWCCYR